MLNMSCFSRKHILIFLLPPLNGPVNDSAEIGGLVPSRFDGLRSSMSGFRLVLTMSSMKYYKINITDLKIQQSQFSVSK